MAEVRPIPENDRTCLETMLRTSVIPDVVEKTYWSYKYLRDALDGGPLQTPELAIIAVLAGCRGEPPPEKVFTEYDKLRNGRYPEGTRLRVKWWNKDCDAVFYSITPLGFSALVEGMGWPEPREITSDRLISICTAS